MEYRLSANIDITIATELKKQYLLLLGTGGPIELHAADVCKVDAAGIQLLASLLMSAKNNNVEVIWTEPSPVLVESFDTLGYGDLLKVVSQ